MISGPSPRPAPDPASRDAGHATPQCRFAHSRTSVLRIPSLKGPLSGASPGIGQRSLFPCRTGAALEQVVLVIHLLIAVALVAVVLLQRSPGGEIGSASCRERVVPFG